MHTYQHNFGRSGHSPHALPNAVHVHRVRALLLASKHLFPLNCCPLLYHPALLTLFYCSLVLRMSTRICNNTHHLQRQQHQSQQQQSPARPTRRTPNTPAPTNSPRMATHSPAATCDRSSSSAGSTESRPSLSKCSSSLRLSLRTDSVPLPGHQ